MAVDGYKAIVEATVRGEKFTLQLTLGDVMAFEDEFGVDWMQTIFGTLRGQVRLVAAALARHHPDMTEEAIAESAFPFRDLSDALDDCIITLFDGPDGLKEKRKRVAEAKALAEEKEAAPEKKSRRGNGSSKPSGSASHSTRSETPRLG